MINNKTIVVLLVVIIGGGIVFGLANFVVPKMLVTMTKAAPSMKVSMNNSYIIGGKILAKADNKDSCIVNVFVIDSSGKGIPGKNVSLTGIEGLNDLQMSGDNGLASFKISSKSEGQFEIVASIEGVPLTKTIKVTFRN